MVPLVLKAPGPAGASVIIPSAIVPPAIIPSVIVPLAIVPPAIGSPSPAFSLGTVALLHWHSPSQIYIPPSIQIFYPLRVIMVDIDPHLIAGRVLGVGGVRVYPWRVVPTDALSGMYPTGYSEAETALPLGTTTALLRTIVGNFRHNRNRIIREIHGQVVYLPYGIALDCPNVQITNYLMIIYWLSRVSGLVNYVHMVQVIRNRSGG